MKTNNIKEQNSMKNLITTHKSKFAALLLGFALMLTAGFALMFGSPETQTASAGTGNGSAYIPDDLAWFGIIYDIPVDEANRYRVNAFTINGGAEREWMFGELIVSGHFYSQSEGGLVYYYFTYTVTNYPGGGGSTWYYVKPINFAMASDYRPYPATSPDYWWRTDEALGDFDYKYVRGEVYTATCSVYAHVDYTNVIQLSSTFIYGLEPVPLPPDPELEHHTFAGWYMDSALTIPYSGQLIYEHTELYAKFTPVTYRITFVTGVVGMNYTPMNVTALTAAGTLPTPSRIGYTFKGWFRDNSLTQPYVPITSMTGFVTLYASWEQIILTVTFYVKGEVYTTVQVPYGTSLSVAVAAAQTDSEIFTALYSDPALHNALSINTVLTSNANIHAELGKGVDTSFFGRVGAWFAASWIWLLVCLLLIGATAATIFIVLKKRGTI